MRRQRRPYLNYYGVFLHNVTDAEGDSMVATNRCIKFEYVTETGEPTGDVYYQEAKPPVPGANTNCTITRGDMQANVGIAETIGRVRSAQTKILKWPKASKRNNAVTISGRQIFGVVTVNHPVDTTPWYL